MHKSPFWKEKEKRRLLKRERKREREREREKERERDCLSFARFRLTSSYQPLCLVARPSEIHACYFQKFAQRIACICSCAEPRISVYANRANRYFESETYRRTLEIFHIAIIRRRRSGKRGFALRTPVKFTWFSFRQRQSTATSALPVPRSLSLRGHRRSTAERPGSSQLGGTWK